MKKVKVNPEACIGCGACQAIIDSVFEIGDDGLAQAKEDNNIIDTMEEDMQNDVMDALEGCPTSAIYIEEEEKEEKEA